MPERWPGSAPPMRKRSASWKFLQYKFDTQWKAVKDYANAKGVKILGDIPIYVSADSVDAWVGGPLFELDGEGRFCPGGRLPAGLFLGGWPAVGQPPV